MVHPYLEYFFATGRKIRRHYFLDLCALFSYAQEGGRKRVRVSVLGAGPGYHLILRGHLPCEDHSIFTCQAHLHR